MAVGAGSIKRASKLNTEAESTKKQAVQLVETKAEEKAPKKAAVKKAEPAKKDATAKKTTAKKTTAKKAVAPKADVQVQNPVNPVYHLTEELPIHLL